MKRALVLSGGGARGAYELGAWKALRELHIDFQIVTGTSIGAVNGALYVQGDFQITEQLWHNITVDEIMTGGVNVSKSFESIINQMDSIGPFLKNYLNSKGADITPFKNILKDCMNEQRFFNSPIDYALITVKFPSMIPIEITKKEIHKAYMIPWVLASASCFPAFPLCEIDGQNYIDGGYHDNLPIASAFRLGADEIVAIDLNPNPMHENYRNHPRIKYIHPVKFLGNMLYFERDQMESNIILGYNDTMKAYSQYFGYKYTFTGLDKQYFADLAHRVVHHICRQETGCQNIGNKPYTSAYINAPYSGALLEHIGKTDVSEFDMFVAAVEICAELLTYPSDTVYNFIEFCRQLARDVRGRQEYLFKDISLISDKRRIIKNIAQKQSLEQKILGKQNKKVIASILMNELNKKS